MKRSLTFLLFAVMAACTKTSTVDPLCKNEPVPESTRLETGHGAVQVMGATDEYFYVRDSASKQVASGAMNRAAGLRPGEYTLLLNNSTHAVVVEKSRLISCACGSVQVTGGTDEYYYVLDKAGNQLASATLGKATSLFPGSYTVKLNNTRAPVDVTTAGPTILQSGLVEVKGTTDEYYYVLDAAGTQLASASLQKRTAVFPGSWTVKVNNTAVKVEIRPGETAMAQTGGLIVRGATDEYYYVLNDSGSQLASAALNKAMTFLPGAYRVKLNNSIAAVKVAPGEVTEVASGTVTAKKAGSEYYYVLDGNGTQLASASVNRSSSLLPGDYTVRVGESRKQATVTAGKDTALVW